MDDQSGAAAASRVRMWTSGMICWTSESNAVASPLEGNRRQVEATV